MASFGHPIYSILQGIQLELRSSRTRSDRPCLLFLVFVELYQNGTPISVPVFNKILFYSDIRKLSTTAADTVEFSISVLEKRDTFGDKLWRDS